MNMMMRQMALCLLAAGCVTAGSPEKDQAGAPPPRVDAFAEELIAKPNVGGMAILKIEGGEIAWSRYYGEQNPGVPVGESTAFNTASVAKTLLAETVLRLVDQGQMAWDDPIAAHYQHPDLKDDPRYALLTPEVILSHQTALRNWPYAYEDRKMAFDAEPAQGEISYSGEAFETLAKYLEARFGVPYPELVDRVVLEPLGIEEITVDRKAWLDGRVSHPVDSDGEVYPPMTWYPGGPVLEMGQWSAADNMYATAPGYAKLFLAILNGDGLSPEARMRRRTILSRGAEGSEFSCTAGPERCPTDTGFAVGWQVFAEPGRTVIGHSGGDYSDSAQVYFIPETEEGLVLFINGGSLFDDSTRLLALLDPELRMAKHYRAILDRLNAETDGSEDSE
jgi:CubicO group peptidase (beta-lactamase class C family)